ncbi:unnamed protein product [Symbiodinium natans]|uniref:C2H2-type domain-containing protein n=1 Tax=Symbiodinium natans TaxID=878477 RepID=A0A812QZ87_9DINO|nr:unnamed protein product [Symbiodinium natans]
MAWDLPEHGILDPLFSKKLLPLRIAELFSLRDSSFGSAASPRLAASLSVHDVRSSGSSATPPAHEGRQCVLPCGAADVDSLLRSVPFCALRPPPTHVQKPERFLQWVAEGCAGRSPTPGEILVLTSDGSFNAVESRAGWAVVLSLVSADTLRLPGQFIGCFYGSVSDFLPALLDEEASFDAYLAEISGLLWAAVAALQLPHNASVLFRADNWAALQGVAGNVSLKDHTLCTGARNLHIAHQTVRGAQALYQHVPGHAGDCANELADGLAELGSRGRSEALPFHFNACFWLSDRGLAIRWLPHLCLTRERPAEVPSLRNNMLSWSKDTGVCSMDSESVLRPFLRAVPAVDSCARAPAHRHFSLCIATFNVLSLLDPLPVRESSSGLHGIIGRVNLLRASLEAKGVHIAGLQECRTPEGVMRCGPFLRLASGCEEGSRFGVELWLHDASPILASSAVVLHAEPTLLVVSAYFHCSRLNILVAHAPHRAHTEEHRQAWWARVCAVCGAHSRGANWICLIDGNCRIGSVPDAHVGPWQADEEDFSGSLFRDLLRSLNVWVPSTFRGCMEGPGGTLLQKRNGALVRSDYICLPLTWQSAFCSVCVAPELSAGHVCEDHYASVAQVQLSFTGKPSKQVRPVRIDASAISNPDNAPAVQAILSSAPRPGWEVDVSEHAALLVDHVYTGLSQCFPVPRRRLRGQHFSERAQQLHATVARLRHSLRSRRAALRCAYLRCVLLAWAQASLDFTSLFSGHWLWLLRARIGLDCLLLHRNGSLLKRQCKDDRNAYFDTLAAGIDAAPAGEVHRAVRKVLAPKRFRRSSADPLPMLRRADGTLCTSMDEVTATWREHFSALEDGCPTSEDSLVASCRLRQACFEGSDSVDSGTVPTWDAFESALRHTKPGKACGPDLLPPALCRVFGSQLAQTFWPLMLKVVCHAAEPVGLKGGLLHHIAKPNIALRHTCAGRRGILVQSCLSKALHRTVRALAVKHWDTHALPLQIGGRRGCSAAIGHFCSRAFLHFARRTSRSSAILFVDLASAYYAVVRETVLGEGLGHRSIEDIAASLGLSRENLQQLQHYISSEPVLEQQDASPLFLELARELHASTWFILHGDTQLVETHRGTRPGGSLADIVFNILFAKVLQRRLSPAMEVSLPKVPWHGQRTPFPDPDCPVQDHVVRDVVYADDLATFVVSPSAQRLPRLLADVAATTLDTLAPHGLRANLGPTKTAAIVAPAGAGARAARKHLFVDMRGHMPVWPENAGLARLDLVTRYRHLGSYLTHNGSLLPDIRYRLALGRAAFREGKRKLFACQQIALGRRAQLFRVHVLGVVLAGTGAWPQLNAQEWSAFSGGLIGLNRRLLGPSATGTWHMTEAQILAWTGLPAPRALLHVERLRFLGQLVRSGPAAAWALIGWYGPYVSALEDAGCWLLSALRGTCPLGPLSESWPAWQELLRDRPGQWKGLLKRAEAWHVQAQGLQASLDTFARAAWSPAVDVPDPSLAALRACSHACLVCGLAFRSLQAWGSHAHRKHGYHCRAHLLAVGRRCQACGLTLANTSRLRRHLDSSAACRQLLATPGASPLFPPDHSEGHPQEPAVRDATRPVRVAAQHECSPELLAALAALKPSTDMDVYETVVRFISPLPVLRDTLQVWLSEVSDLAIAEMGENVLLVLHPEHICSAVAGKPQESNDQHVFLPLLRTPLAGPTDHSLPVVWVGHICPRWVQTWQLGALPPVPCGLEDVIAGAFPQAAGFCIALPSLPSPVSVFFRPDAMPLKCLRALCAWLDRALKALLVVLRQAQSGVPALVRFPISAESLQPLSGWLLSLAELDAGSLRPSCFTVEFTP